MLHAGSMLGTTSTTSGALAVNEPGQEKDQQATRTTRSSARPSATSTLDREAGTLEEAHQGKDAPLDESEDTKRASPSRFTWQLRLGAPALELNDSYQEDEVDADTVPTQLDQAMRVEEEHVAFEEPANVSGGAERLSAELPGRADMTCEEHRARLLREWEEETMCEAMNGVAPEAGALLVIRGGVRRVHGGQGTTQTIMFRIREGETLDLRIAMPELMTGADADSVQNRDQGMSTKPGSGA